MANNRNNQNNQNNQIASISRQIVNGNNLHEFEPRDVQIFAIRWDQQRTLSGYDILKLKLGPICNTLLIFDLEVIEKIALYIWEHLTTLEEQDIHTNIAFRVNEYKRVKRHIFGSPAPGLMRYHGVEKKEPEDLPMKPIKHTDESEILFHGCDFPEPEP
ncbi:6123_t:CDS:1, partial [Cetraspora pellucida]